MVAKKNQAGGVVDYIIPAGLFSDNICDSALFTRAPEPFFLSVPNAISFLSEILVLSPNVYWVREKI